MKKIILRIVISVCILPVAVFAFYKISGEKYESNDSLHGSFSIENGEIGG